MTTPSEDCAATLTVAAAVSAERKRIADLATESGATCIAQGGVEIPFADLIGEEGND